MRIAIVIGPFLPVPPALGGAVEKVHLALAHAYVAAGHEVTIVSRRFRDFALDEIVDGIRHLRVRSFERSSSLAANFVRDLVYALRVAWVLPPAEVTITNGFFLPIVLPRRRAGRIYVQIGRYPKHQIFLYFRASRLQAVSRAVAEAIIRQSPWMRRKVKVIGYAIPPIYFRPSPVVREKTILFVGRLAREKGIELLIEAFARLCPIEGLKGVEDWKLRIIGPHDVAQGGDGTEHLQRLQALAAPLGARCEFTGPLFDESALIGHYQSSAVFVYPSLAEFGETLGVAPLEAMAAGCAVVVSKLRCFDDYLVDGVTGLTFDHRNPDPGAMLAAQLRRLIEDEALRQRVAEAGHHAACAFSVETIAARMLADFAEVVAEGDASL